MSTINNSGKKVTIEEIVNQADSCFAICRKTITAGADPQFVLSNLRKDHKDFALAYPTVLQHMCLDGLYFSKVFKAYLQKLEKAPWTDDNSRLEYYTEYYMMSLRAAARKSKCGVTSKSPAEWTRIRQEYLNILRKSHKDFFENCKKVEKEVEAAEDDRLKDRRAYILDKIMKIREERKTLSKEDGTIFCRGCGAEIADVLKPGGFIYKYSTKEDQPSDEHFFCDPCFLGPKMIHPASSYEEVSYKSMFAP